MKIAVGIETKDRRLVGGQNYIGETLRNLARTDFWSSPALHSVTIVSGGDGEDFFETEIQPNLPAYNSPGYRYLGCPLAGCTRQQNAARAIREAAHAKRYVSPPPWSSSVALDGPDWVLKLEDDLDFIDSFMGSLVAWLEDYGEAQVPMFSLGATFEQVSQSRFQEGETLHRPGPSFPNARKLMARGDAIVACNVAGYWGAQALLWKAPMARQLADWLGPDPALFDGREYHRERGHDLLMQVWGRSLEARAFAVAVPSFVQHIGRQSNIQNPFFEFPFPGREWSYTRRSHA